MFYSFSVMQLLLLMNSARVDSDEAGEAAAQYGGHSIWLLILVAVIAFIFGL